MFLYDALMKSTRSFLQPFAPTFLRLTSLLVWAVVAYSAVVFGLQWGGGVPVDAVVAGSEQKQVSPDVDSLSVSKALGVAPRAIGKCQFGKSICIGGGDGWRPFPRGCAHICGWKAS